MTVAPSTRSTWRALGSKLDRSLRTEMRQWHSDAAQKAADCALVSRSCFFLRHGRPISRALAEQKLLRIVRLETDPSLQDAVLSVYQDAVLSVYHATAHTFTQTGAVKIIENHLGKAYMEVMQMMFVGMPPQQLPQPAQPSQPSL